jgi:hypothetical protein
MVIKIKLSGICDKLTDLAHSGITKILLLPIGTFLIFYQTTDKEKSIPGTHGRVNF